MIKRILVALDPGTDSLVATQFAINIARATGARITGLAVVDTEHIESSSRGGGIGSMYYAEKLKENLTQETREHARKLINNFEKNVEGSGVDHIEMMEEGVPFQRIVEDMKYHDLLIMGSDPHFFYSHPKQRTNTLAGVFHNTIGPSLIVPDHYREVKNVLYATDGENSSSRAIRQFIQMAPFGSDIEFEILHVHSKDDVDAELHMELTKAYLECHGFVSRVVSMIDSDPARCIIEQAETGNYDLIVAGSHTSKGIMGYKLSSTTVAITENDRIPVFIDH